MNGPPKLTKQQLCDAIASALGVPKDPLGPGSKEHIWFLRSIAKALGLKFNGRKPEIARRILHGLDQPWDASCISTGDTVTGIALERILAGLGAIPERTSAVHDALVEQWLTSGSTLQPPVGNAAPKRLRTGHDVFVRSPEVAAYILLRANGRCEACGSAAPFMRTDGTPYLEVHHVTPLAEGGADTVDNTMALCPTCHRRAHHANDREAFSRQLRAQLVRERRAGSAPPSALDQGR